MRKSFNDTNNLAWFVVEILRRDNVESLQLGVSNANEMGFDFIVGPKLLEKLLVFINSTLSETAGVSEQLLIVP